MNRPPKKKHEPSARPEPEPGPATPEPNAPETSQDDRNLVNIDQAFQEADVEDKVWLFWQRNKFILIGGAVLALVAVLVVEGYRYYLGQSEVKVQEAYQQASSEDSLALFGQSHSSNPLGGFALLRAADESYSTGSFSDASSLYAQASPSLNGTPFYGRAVLGEAISTLKAGDEANAKAMLVTLSENTQALETIRGEALFNLALLSLEEGNYAESRNYLKTLEAMPQDSIWAQQAKALITNTPELANIEEAAPDLGEADIRVTPATEAILENDAVTPESAMPSDANLPDTDAAEDAE